MPIWILIELFSFGSLINLYLFCTERWGDREMAHEHCILRHKSKSTHSSKVMESRFRRVCQQQVTPGFTSNLCR